MSTGYSISESAAKQATDSFTLHAQTIKQKMQQTSDACTDALRLCRGSQFLAFFGLVEKINADMRVIGRELDVQGQLVAQASSGYSTANSTVTDDYTKLRASLPGMPG